MRKNDLTFFVLKSSYLLCILDIEELLFKMYCKWLRRIKGAEQMYNQYAFVYESGNYAFDFEDELTSNYFIVTVMIIGKEQIESIESKLKEMPLDSIVGMILVEDREAWYDILFDLDFSVYTIIVDKKKLFMDGGHGEIETSFAYLHEKLYHDLFTELEDIVVYADDQTTLFTESLRQFIQERQQPSLFNQSAFMYRDTQKDVLMQLVELTSDLIFAEYEYNQQLPSSLLSKIIRKEIYPTFEFQFESDHPLDNMIAEEAVQLARSYIKDHEGSDIRVVIDRVNFLKYLLTQLASNPNQSSYSQEVIANLKALSRERISKEYLMSDIIGPLRDLGILIASTSKGYKLPTSGQDLIDYVDFSSSMALPMLRRIKRSRENILALTNGELDITQGENGAELKGFFKEK